VQYDTRLDVSFWILGLWKKKQGDTLVGTCRVVQRKSSQFFPSLIFATAENDSEKEKNY
jgi:hypothetical protein